jgi:hypothetical protein
MTRIKLTIALLLGLALPAAAQLSTWTASHIGDGQGGLLTSGVLCAQPTGQVSAGFSFNGGQNTGAKICRDVASGILLTTLHHVEVGAMKTADGALSTPLHPCYNVTVVDGGGAYIIGSPAAFGGYTCVQPSGSTYNFDNFVPNLTPVPLGLSIANLHIQYAVIDNCTGAGCGSGGALPSDSGNKIMATPSDGSGGVAALRPQVVNDVPALPESKITSLVADLANKQTVLGYTPENVTNKDANSGYAGLDSGGKLKTSEAPTWNQSTTGNANTATNFDHTPAGSSGGGYCRSVNAHGDCQGDPASSDSDIVVKAQNAPASPSTACLADDLSNGVCGFVDLGTGLWSTENTSGTIVNYVPSTRTVNGHALSSNVTVTASDLGLATVATTGSYNDLSSKPTIPAPYTSTPAMDGTGSAGSSANYAKGDHVHPTDTSRAADSAVVHNTTSETVAGVKTFSSSPIVPTPTTSTQAANKAYVDGLTPGAQIACSSISAGSPPWGICTATISSAQILAMSSSPSNWVTVIPAQGANKFIDVTKITGEFICNSCTPYTLSLSPTFEFYYGTVGAGTSDAGNGWSANGWSDQTASTWQAVGPITPTLILNNADVGDTTNVGFIFGTSGTGGWTLGTGTVKLTIEYTIVQVQ